MHTILNQLKGIMASVKWVCSGKPAENHLQILHMLLFEFVEQGDQHKIKRIWYWFGRARRGGDLRGRRIKS